MKEKVMEALKEHFKPEFLNRVDEIIVFHPLDEAEIRRIVDLQLSDVYERLKEKRMTMDVTDRAKKWLAKKGYDPNLGARPLKRVIQSELLDQLAMKIISGALPEGSAVNVDVIKDKLDISGERVRISA